MQLCSIEVGQLQSPFMRWDVSIRK